MHKESRNINENDRIIIYQTEDGQTSIDVKMEGETVWLSANQMAKLFEGVAKTVRKHINKVFAEGELEKESNTHFLRVAGVDQFVAFYSLDVIISETTPAEKFRATYDNAMVAIALLKEKSGLFNATASSTVPTAQSVSATAHLLPSPL